MKRLLSALLSIALLITTLSCSVNLLAAAEDTQVVKKDYPTLPKGYEISQQFTFDDDGNCSDEGCFYDRKSKKITLENENNETRYSFFNNNERIKLDGAGFSFWYKSDSEVTVEIKIAPWLYLDAAPEGRWVTYYYQGNIFYDNDPTKAVRRKTDVRADIRAVLESDPDKTYNISFYRGKGDFYVDEVFTFKAAKTQADVYDNDNQAFKFSLDKYDYQKNTVADYIGSGDENGSVILSPAPNTNYGENVANITYKMNDTDKAQFKKAVEIAKQGTGFLQVKCSDLLCKNKSGADTLAKVCLTIMHIDSYENEKTKATEYVDKKLSKWINGSGSCETFLINVNDIERFDLLSEIKVEIYAWDTTAENVKIQLSPLTVYNYPESEIIIQAEDLKAKTTDHNGNDIATTIENDDENDTNRKFLHISGQSRTETEIELPKLEVGEYDVYACISSKYKQNTVYTLAVNNLIQNKGSSASEKNSHFQLWFTDENPNYSDRRHISNISMGKIKITKDYKDGPTVLKFISFFGSGAPSQNTEMYIDYFSFKKTTTAVTAEPSSNFEIKDYPEPENYEKLRLLNDYNDFVRSDDTRFYWENQIYGYVGDKNAYNLNSRKSQSKAGMEPNSNMIWYDKNNMLDGSAMRFWFKFEENSLSQTESNYLSMQLYCQSSKYEVAVRVTKQNGKFIYTASDANRNPIEIGDYDTENGSWATIYYNKVVENGDLSDVYGIGFSSNRPVYIDELHTIQQKIGDINYTVDAGGKTASVTGYNLRIVDPTILTAFNNVPVTSISDNALSKTLTLNSVTLPSTVTTIGKNAFAGDMNLKTINLESGVTTIGENAFKDCRKLGEVYFSDKVTSIADNAFENCTNLIMNVPYNSYAYKYAVKNGVNYRTVCNDFDFYKIGDEIHIKSYVGTKTHVTIPETIENLPVTKILSGAFVDKNVTSVTSASVKIIESEAFSNNSSLKSINLTNLDSIGEKAFYNCTSLNSAVIGDKITTIAASAFENDAALRRIALSATLTSIDNTAFANCSEKLVADVVRDSYAYTFVNTRQTAIMQIPSTTSEFKYSLWMYTATVIGYTGSGLTPEIPKTIDGYTVVAVGENAFKGNTAITSVKFSDKCKEVGDFAFFGCSSLNSFEINAVLQLGHSTFQNCPSLKNVTITNVTKYWSDTFDSGVNINIDQSQFGRTATELVNSLHAGINIGCAFETTAYDAYGTFTEEQARNFCSGISKNYIKLLADSGFDLVRFPITWSAFVNDSNNYTIDKAYLDRVQEIVDWIVDEGMYVIVNTHHDSSEYNLTNGWLNLYNCPGNYEKFRRVWEQISERFKDYDEHVIFESLNEPRYNAEWDPKTAGSNQSLNELQKIFYDVVRKSGGNNTQRYVMLETYAAAAKTGQCSDFTNTWKSYFDNDDHMIVSVHFYDNRIGGGYFDYIFQCCKQYFTDNGMACIMGESATGLHSPLSDLQNNTLKKDFNGYDIDWYKETGELKAVTKDVNARDYDDWYVSTWLDEYLNAMDNYDGIILCYWEDGGSQALLARGDNPWWYFPSAIDTFMNHGYNITVDGEKITLKDLSFTLPNDNPNVDYYTNGKVKFSPGASVSLKEIKDKTEIVSVMKSVEPSTVPATTQQHTIGNPTTTTIASSTAGPTAPSSTLGAATTTTTSATASTKITTSTNVKTTTAPATTDIPTTVGFLYGDVNCDDKVTAADVLLVRKHIAGQKVTLNTDVADVNLDEKITAADILLIRKFIAGQNVTLGH